MTDGTKEFVVGFFYALMRVEANFRAQSGDFIQTRLVFQRQSIETSK